MMTESGNMTALKSFTLKRVSSSRAKGLHLIESAIPRTSVREFISVIISLSGLFVWNRAIRAMLSSEVRFERRGMSGDTNAVLTELMCSANQISKSGSFTNSLTLILPLMITSPQVLLT